MSGQTCTRRGIGFWVFVGVLFAVFGGGIWAHVRETQRQRTACETRPGRVLVEGRNGNWCVVGEREGEGR